MEREGGCVRYVREGNCMIVEADDIWDGILSGIDYERHKHTKRKKRIK